MVAKSEIHTYELVNIQLGDYYDWLCPVCKRHILFKAGPEMDCVVMHVGNSSVPHIGYGKDFVMENPANPDETIEDQFYDPFEEWARRTDLNRRFRENDSHTPS